jgi:3-deoxy-D-manno-octulosonic-acid transferase
VAASLAEQGLAVVRRSSLGPALEQPMPAAQVLIGDTIGEMSLYYAMADLVFVGASLVDHGGHNIMEPMALGRPVVMGPSTYGIAFAADPAARAGAFETLPDAAALQDRIAALIADPVALGRMSEAATRFAASHGGAAARTAAGLMALLAPKGGGS